MEAGDLLAPALVGIDGDVVADGLSGPEADDAARRELIEAGKYTPRSWLMIWPRQALLRWADKEHRRQAALAEIIEKAEETGRIDNPA